jgi:hypothetical protein
MDSQMTARPNQRVDKPWGYEDIVRLDDRYGRTGTRSA